MKQVKQKTKVSKNEVSTKKSYIENIKETKAELKVKGKKLIIITEEKNKFNQLSL